MYYFKGKNFAFPLNERTYIMGILNVTPDSFFDGGEWNTPQRAVAHALEMQENGADIIDVGAQSTRPGSTLLSENEELEIIKQYMDLLCDSVSVPISADTFYPSVADYCLSHGAAIINDVSGVINTDMAAVVSQHNAGWIVVHTGQKSADETADFSNVGGVTNGVIKFFDEAEKTALNYGIKKENLCFDMGIGFGKSYDDNLELVRNINKLKAPERALLTALSCKRIVKETTDTDGYDRVFGTIAADVLSIAGGTDFIRVHHVKEAALSAKMADKLVRG